MTDLMLLTELKNILDAKKLASDLMFNDPDNLEKHWFRLGELTVKESLLHKKICKHVNNRLRVAGKISGLESEE